MAEVNGNDQHLSGLRVMLSAAVGSIFLFFWVSNCDWGRFFLLNFFFFCWPIHARKMRVKGLQMTTTGWLKGFFGN